MAHANIGVGVTIAMTPHDKHSAPSNGADGSTARTLRLVLSEPSMLADGTQVRTIALDDAQRRALADHVLRDIPVVPGAVLVCAALAATRDGAHAAGLTGITFHRMLTLQGQAPSTLDVAVLPLPDGSARVRVVGLPDVRSPDARASAAGHPHASMTAAPAATAISRSAWAERQDVAPTHDGPEERGADFYAGLRAHGNAYGPAFRAVQRIWRTPGRSRAEIQLPDGALLLDGADLPPVLLDAACQTLLAADPRTADRTYVLLGIDALQVLRAPGPRCWAEATVVDDASVASGPPGDRELVGDVRLVDHVGDPLVEIQGVRFAALPPERTPPATDTDQTSRITVAATFTADPVQRSLDFWLAELGMSTEVVMAPYNQPFQQLLDPSSLFASNQQGLNVLLVRFEDWLRSDARPPTEPERRRPDTSSPGNADAAAFLPLRASALGRHTLPNGLTIAHVHEYETAYLYDEIFVREAYLRHGIVLDDGACVVDVGANIGLFTLFVSTRCRGARVFAVEPSPEPFAALQANAALIRNAEVRVFNRGLGAEIGEQSFTVYGSSTLFSSFHADPSVDQQTIAAIVQNLARQHDRLPADPPAALLDQLTHRRVEREVITVPVQSLSGLIDELEIERIDLLKIDAERSEADILRGIRDEHWDRIEQVVAEVHHPSDPNENEIVSVLRDRGFTVVAEEDAALHGTGLSSIYATRSRSAAVMLGDAAAPAAALEANLDQLIRAVRTALPRLRAPLLVCICPSSETRDTLQRDFERLERKLVTELRSLDGVQVVAASELAATYPVADSVDPRANALGHVPYTPAGFAAIGTTIARRYVALTRPPYKVIVVDCDQTLWVGLCGEDGAANIHLDPARRALQERLLEQRGAGLLLCLCSKNDEADVVAAFEQHPEMPLRLSDVVARRMSWRPKSEGVRSIAAELGLALDSVIVLDDDPVECAEIESACPEALVLQVPRDPAEMGRFLAHTWAFDSVATTAEDRQRSRAYQDEARRARLRTESLSFQAFLDALELDVRIGPPTSDEVARVAQLLRRTNQFRLQPGTPDEAELRDRLQHDEATCLVARVRDRFGDYGLVGVMLLAWEPTMLRVENVLLSCRALGRGVEHQMLAMLGRLAVGHGQADVVLQFRDSGRNRPALDFVHDLRAQLGLPLAEAAGRGPLSTLRLPALALSTLTFRPKEARPAQAEPAEPSRRSATPSATASPLSSGLARRIAGELGDMDRLVEEIGRARSGRPGAGPAPPAAPAGDLEGAIRDVWREVLGVEHVTSDDKFFELGGRSLDAVIVASEIQRRLGIEVSSIDLFAEATVGAMATMLRAERSAAWHDRVEASRSRGERRRSHRAARPNAGSPYP